MSVSTGSCGYTSGPTLNLIMIGLAFGIILIGDLSFLLLDKTLIAYLCKKYLKGKYTEAIK